MSELENVLRALSAIRVPAQPEEYEIHAEVAKALDAAGLSYVHECKLRPPRCRIDFLCGTVGIEVKKGRPDAARLREQLARYLADERLHAAVAVLQRPCALPESIADKPVHVVALNRLWGVALP